jgi:hypothetical protein
MKKGKPKPYVKKEPKPWNKIAILAIAAIMVVSGLYFSGVQNSDVGDSGGVKVKSYGIEQVMDGAYALIAEKRPELVAMLGDRAAARLTQYTVEELLNTTVGTVYNVKAEQAGNSFVLFRFYASDSRKAMDGLKPLLDGALSGDYTMYSVYTGVQPGGASGDVRMELLCTANASVNPGSLVKILLLKRKYAQADGTQTEDYFGFVKNQVPFGPNLKATVNGVDGFALWGLTDTLQDADKLKNASGGDASYQPPSISVNGYIDEAALNVTGVKLTAGVNYTIVEPANASKDEVLGRLVELGLNYTLLSGTITVALPLDANLSFVEEGLGGMNFTNITVQKLGRVALPEEVAMENTIVPISNNGNTTAVLFMNATSGVEIDVTLRVLRFGDQYIVNARQV